MIWNKFEHSDVIPLSSQSWFYWIVWLTSFQTCICIGQFREQLHICMFSPTFVYCTVCHFLWEQETCQWMLHSNQITFLSIAFCQMFIRGKVVRLRQPTRPRWNKQKKIIWLLWWYLRTDIEENLGFNQSSRTKENHQSYLRTVVALVHVPSRHVFASFTL